ncbi:Na/Pi cotransporter family protein [Xanthobacter dioxanivorans]|uniref:Na/Pi cotransporter family protein n=1 Tax=Xanthobacter dioxanivorans TaxID=2528964 RepID=A0A974PRX4_9HYPH|nr:Na/Pi symporter [Xanthobacter dioxanivorans]QRG08565.1 Na/Pi cotransporter family protein [Xanthobacter dioxanivorans]
MTVLAEILAGLGLLFVGLRIMATHLQQATGRKVRRLLRGATRSPLAGLACGTLAGLATQSSNAVAVVCGNLVRGGVFATRDAIPVVAGGNVGTAGLVFIAAIDFRLVVLYLVAAVGFTFHLRLDRRSAWREWMGVGLGLALALLGLDFIKHGPADIDVEALAGTLSAGITPLLAFGLGFLASAVTQSSSTPTILVVALIQARLLGLHDAFFLVLGANLGSGFAVLISSSGLAGTGRQLCYVHVLVKVAGCLLVGAAFAVLGAAGADPFALLAGAGGGTPTASVSVLFLLLQVAGALPVALLRGTAEAIAMRLSPPTVEDDAARPRFIDAQARQDPATALDLAERETLRLLHQLPLLLPDLDGAEAGDAQVRLGTWRGGASVALAVDHFLADLIAHGMPRESLRIALHHQSLLETVRTLQDTLHDFTEVIEGFEDVPPLGFNLSEALRAIVLSLADAAGAEAADLDIIITLAGDRSELLNRIRRQLAASALGSDVDTRQLLFATSLFERAVWLVRRIAVALRTPDNEAKREASVAADTDLKRVEADAHRA